MTFEIPSTMKQLVVTASGATVADCKLEIQEVPTPKPEPGEVLVKVAAAPINPSDYGTWTRLRPDQCPHVMGKEGSGIVVAHGSSMLSGFLYPRIGSKVGLIGLPKGQGSYSEYVTVSAMTGAFSMPDSLPVEDAASFFVNPYTALGIFDTARQNKSPAFVHTAAASQLGLMMAKLEAIEPDITIVHVVRRQEQAKMLQDVGAKHIVVTNEDDWKAKLKTKITELKVSVAFDAVAGTMTGDLINVLPSRGQVIVYGGLGGPVGNTDPMDLIYRKKTVRGFILSSWVQGGGTVAMMLRMRAASAKVAAGLGPGGWCATHFVDTTMEKAQDEIAKRLASKITGEKLRVRFDWTKEN